MAWGTLLSFPFSSRLSLFFFSVSLFSFSLFPFPFSLFPLPFSLFPFNYFLSCHKRVWPGALNYLVRLGFR